MKKENYEGFKVIQLDSEYENMWDVVGSRDKYSCPECIYLGMVCDKCKEELI